MLKIDKIFLFSLATFLVASQDIKVGGQKIVASDHSESCRKQCGEESKCLQGESGEVYCMTKCGPGRKFDTKTNRCLHLGEWGQWGQCSKRCGSGRQIRERNCYKTPCFRASKRRLCNPKPCDSSSSGGASGSRSRGSSGGASGPGSGGSSGSGQWEPWGRWSGCSRTCGTGHQKRLRLCSSHGIGDCDGKVSELRECSVASCVRIPVQDCSRRYGIQQIIASKTFRWEWSHPKPFNNRFGLQCQGGCIQVVQATVNCEGFVRTILPFLKRRCGGRNSCSFIPGPATFGLHSCLKFHATILVKCVGGIARIRHRQAVEELTGGVMVYNDKRYRCSTNTVSWDQAKTACSNDGWRLAMPKDTHLLERLRHLCGLESVPFPSSLEWWTHVQTHGWDRYMYWIGAKKKRGTFQYLDGSHISSSMYYPGEPTFKRFTRKSSWRSKFRKRRKRTKNCIQGNGKLDTNFCDNKMRFVCEQQVPGQHWS